MAYLLGAAAVMDSLQRDVRDVQGCITDIISRVGPAHYTSWKFPDKVAADLDIEDLLDLYSYSDDEEERQVAHIALYELVIDRLVLLMHTMASFTEGILRNAKVEDDGEQKSGTSVGVVVKKYWSRLSQMQQAVKHIISEKNAMSRKVSDLEGDVSRLNSDLKQAYQTHRPKTAGFGGLIPPNRAEMVTGLSLNPAQLKEFGLISKDEYNKSCQTNETSFAPCESCSIVQRSFRQSGELVVSICQQQQIPSCLQKFRPQVSHLDWLSGNDVARWSAEQNKDLQRISKLTATIKPLQTELTECRTRSDKLENRVLNFDRDLKKERDERVAVHRQYEFKIQEMERQHTQTMELERQQKELLEMNKQELEKVLDKHKNELAEQQSLLKELETTKSRMEEELSSNKVNMSEVEKYEKEMSELNKKLEDVETNMEKSVKELHKEQAKNKSVSKHTQNLQSKQDALLQRINMLDQENQDLREEVAELEEEKEKFEDSVNEIKRETVQLERKLKEKEGEIEQAQADKESLEQTIATLETSVQNLSDRLEEAKERERLIVEYPDINGPVNPDLIGTGDIVVDMESQVKANIIRIQLLETQNEGLRNSITKLLALQQQQQQEAEPVEQQTQWATHVKSSKPQPLWEPNYQQTHVEDLEQRGAEYSHMEYKYNHVNTAKPHTDNQYHVHTEQGSNKPKSQSGIHNLAFDSASVKQNKTPPKNDRPPFGHRPLTSGKKGTEEFVVGKSVRPESAKTRPASSSGSVKSVRPSSGKTYMTPVNTNSISAYIQMKKAGKLNMTSYTGAASHKPTASRPGSSKPHIPQAGESDRSYVKQENFMCETCDKMYTRFRDLQIHKSYCTG